MLLYATHHYQEIEDLTIFKPNGEVLTHIDKSKYRYLPTAIVDGKTIPDKKVFINQIPVTNQDEDGVYSAVIATMNGLKHHYHDLVETEQLIALPTLSSPSHQSADISLTPTLKWGQVKGAKLYQVFIKDNWTGKTVLTSKMLSETNFTVPNDLLKSGGWYAWKVHARDMDETKIYGDFNAGSISRTALFSTIE